MTKREKYEIINRVFTELDNEYKDEIVNLCETEVAALDRKNEKARERAAMKKEAGDALREQIAGMLGNEPMTVEDIVAEINDPAITRAKVVARMSQLVKAERAAKDFIKVDKRKIVAYTAC